MVLTLASPTLAVTPADPWKSTLVRHVSDGGVRYAALARDRRDLDAFLARIGAVRLADASAAERLAFAINAYNATVIARVLERYPGLRSVRDVEGFFDGLEQPVAGERLTLDAIERGVRTLDARVHFALVCGAASCPPLRAEPYTAQALERQLEDQTRRFLADERNGLRYDARANVLWLSSLFRWYAADFGGDEPALLAWILPRLPDGLARTIRARRPALAYLDYDWGLNDRTVGSGD